MRIKEAQNKILESDESRGWDKHWNLRNMLSKLVKEVGGIWNILKLIDDETQMKIVAENKNKISDDMGNILLLILIIANQMKIDSETSLKNALLSYEKIGYANKLIGGIDNK